MYFIINYNEGRVTYLGQQMCNFFQHRMHPHQGAEFVVQTFHMVLIYQDSLQRPYDNVQYPIHLRRKTNSRMVSCTNNVSPTMMSQ